MEKGREDKLIDRDLGFLRQASLSLEQAEKKLEETYRKKRSEQFNAVKKFILRVNRKVVEESGK